jgi:hypothetical protein
VKELTIVFKVLRKMGRNDDLWIGLKQPVLDTWCEVETRISYETETRKRKRATHSETREWKRAINSETKNVREQQTQGSDN